MYTLKVERFICLHMFGTYSTLCSFLSVLVICRVIFIGQMQYIAKSLFTTTCNMDGTSGTYFTSSKPVRML